MSDGGRDARAGGRRERGRSRPHLRHDQGGRSPGYDVAGYLVTSDAPALPEIARTTPDYVQRFKVSMLAYSWCGTTIGKRTYVVHVVFPKMLAARDGAAVSVMDLFESRMPSGWTVWDNYS